MTDEIRGFWRSMLTWPNAVALAVFLLGVGGWWQKQAAFEVGVDAHVTRLETRLDQKDQKEVINEVTRAEVTLKLAQIQSELAALRDEVKDVKTEVRKIR